MVSKLGDKGWLESSSVSGVEYFCGDMGETLFSISFDNGELSPDGSFGRKRCVRQDDQDACVTAKKYNIIYYWNFYNEHYPEGKCSAEAESALDKLTCEKAKKKDETWYWKKYLENFPQGKCAEEARTALKELDKKDCEHARTVKEYYGIFRGPSWYWKRYLEDFQEGECAEEAKSVLKGYDTKACKKAKEKNKYDDWKSYLKEYPQGECVEEAKKNLTIGRLEWSDRSNDEMNWQDAVDYCNNLKELGYTDWRLPNIDELRVLVQNCPKTERGGECRVSAKNGCLAVECQKPEGSCSCEENEEIKYSRLRNNYSYWLWSSSTLSDSGNSAWRIDFSNAEVGDSYKVGENYVRCVR